MWQICAKPNTTLFPILKNSHFQEHTAQKNKFSVIDFVVNLNKSVWDGGFIQIY